MSKPELTPSPSATTTVGQRKVLVVDDVHSVRYYHTYILKKGGFHCEIANDGQEALQKLKAETFDLVVIDILMPNVNGLELLKQIHANPSLAKIPVLVISSEPVGDQVRQERTATTGPVGYSQKPLFPDTVFEEIRHLID